MINQKLLQQEYGFLGNMVHVNACSVGVPPMRTQKAAGQFMEQYLPMVYDSTHNGFEWLRQKVRIQLAGLINCEAEEIAFTKNTSEGSTFLAQGLPLGAGDNVVLADLENTSHLYPWLHAAEQRGFAVKLIRTDARNVSTKDYLDAIDAQTKVVAVSAVQAGCGARVDLAEIGRYCKERGVVLAVDAIQGLGRIAIDVQACGIDYLTCGAFKGLAAGFGIAFVFCRKSLISDIIPLSAGDTSICGEELEPPEVYRPEDMKLEFLLNAERFEAGSTNTPGIWQLHHSLQLIEEIGKDVIESHVLELESSLREELAGCGLDLLPPGDLPSGLVVAWYPRENYEEAEAILQKYDIHLSHHAGYLRLSLTLHNTMEQMKTIAKAFFEIGKLG